MRKGSKHLKIASIVVILLGVISILAVQLLLGTSESAGNYSEDVLKGALAGVVGLYALNIFKIIVGVIGLIMSNKKSVLTVALGFLLFIRAACSILPERQRDLRDCGQHYSACNPILLSA